MDGQDTTALNMAQSVPAEAAKPNVFNEVFRFLGNHHSLDFMPLGKVPLPYMFWDQGSFHVFPSEEAVISSGIYTVDTSKDVSPIAEKGGVLRTALRKDGTHEHVG